jgi:tryptophanyl-tRNA synthetase
VTRVLSGIQPTGRAIHLGNYIGALRQWVADQDVHDSFYVIVDLHAITVPQDPQALRSATLDMAAGLLAVGIDPHRSTLFVQSHVHEHAELSWVLSTVTGLGELRRMTQFKDRVARYGEGSVSAGLFTYPVLQAADILIYQADRVPVGEDQRQHIELTRDLVERFNARYGPTFTLPSGYIPEVGARIMDLQDPTTKMSKSRSSAQGKVLVLEDLASVAKKIKRAVTDAGSEVRYDPVAKPGVSNLLSLLAVATGGEPVALAERYEQYGPLKADTAEAVVELLRPVQACYAELAEDPGHVAAVLADGAARAAELSEPVLARAQRAMGFLR